jgi:hypothetical protein
LEIINVFKEGNEMRRTTALLIALMAGLVLAAGCAKEIKPTTPIQELEAPKWVKKGSGAFKGDIGKIFYGVGSAFGVKNPSLLRTTADNRARSEIAKVFQFYTSSLMKDYMASTMAGDPQSTAEEQHVEQAVKTVTSMTLSGVLIVDHWQNPATGELFSLARLDLKAFKDNLEKARELNRRVKEYIRENADRLHEELKEEEDKMQGR